MGERKAPTPCPVDAVKPVPPPAPPKHRVVRYLIGCDNGRPVRVFTSEKAAFAWLYADAQEENPFRFTMVEVQES